MEYDTQYPEISKLLQLTSWNGRNKIDLNNVKKLLSLFDNPQDSISSVIIGGTNGKGSVSATIASILGASGYKVGLNISPHLINITERVLIDGKEISLDKLNYAAGQIISKSRSNNINITFHEAITVAAMIIFSQESVDWAVYEVGVGGRLDAANTVNSPKAVSIVTVDFDHEQILGNTMAQIAKEKAGIIKCSAPVVIGKLLDEAKKVIEEQCSRSKAKLLSMNENYCVTSSQGVYKAKLVSGNEIDINSNLPGTHQVSNMTVAAQVAEVIGCDRHSIEKGISNVYWPARLEIINYKAREIIIDASHNPAGMLSLKDFLLGKGISKVDLAIGFINTKNWKKMLDIIAPLANSFSILSPISNDAAPCEEIRDYISSFGISNFIYSLDYKQYVNNINLEIKIPLVLCGSIYLIGELRNVLGIRTKDIWKRVKSINL
jgi:dihydrofolate synthase / folylpolyglutamate synthase